MVATIRDVAKLANVSVATVSRYVNGTRKVRGKTAERVKFAIEELGFRPNAVGRSLSTSTTKSIGMVIPSISNPVFSDAVSGVSAAIRKEGYSLTLTTSQYSPEGEVDAISTLLENRVDGVILTVTDPETSKALELLEKSAVPFVMIYNQPSSGRATMTVDNVAAGKEVAGELIKLGHKRLGMVSGKFASSDRALARMNGFVKGVRDARLTAPVICEVDFEAQDISDVLEPMFKDMNAAPSALFCSNDILAISVIGALRRLKIAVPKEVSVIGFDGIAVGRHMYPTLATVVQPSKEMGKAAARNLFERLAGGQDPQSVILPHEFTIGESAGPAAKHDPTDLQTQSKPTSKRSPT
ncbi:MAG: LacI family DNA-binding transcriptional regulator [Sneathiella sp.]|nr:LacI family DNA-binding transcriptional regulator [Sneathiella sp.]